MGLSENQLRDLQRKISGIEKDKHRIEGKLDSELKSLAGLISDDCDPDDAEEKAADLILVLKKKRKKAKSKIAGIFDDIEKQAEKLGLQI